MNWQYWDRSGISAQRIQNYTRAWCLLRLSPTLTFVYELPGSTWATSLKGLSHSEVTYIFEPAVRMYYVDFFCGISEALLKWDRVKCTLFQPTLCFMNRLIWLQSWYTSEILGKCPFRSPPNTILHFVIVENIQTDFSFINHGSPEGRD